MSRQLECQTVGGRLEVYLDGELAMEDRTTFEAHLGKCPDCAAELELASRIRDELRSWPELETPPHVLRKVFRHVGAERFAAARPGASRTPRRVPAWAALAAAVLAATVLGTGIYVASRESAPRPSLTSPELAAAGGLDPSEIARATEETRMALAFFARVSRQTGLKVRDDVLIDRLVKPSADTLTRAFRPLVPAADDGPPAGRDQDRS